MNTYKIKIALPQDITVNIPALTELDIEQVFNSGAMKMATELVKEEIAKQIAQKIFVDNKHLIAKIVDKKSSELEDGVVLQVISHFKND